MPSLLALWRVALHRTRADWPVVLAAWLITLFSAALFAAGPMYSSAASLAGLRSTLADAPAGDTTIQVSMFRDPEAVGVADGAVRPALAAAISPLSGTIVRYTRSSASLDLPPVPSAQGSDQAILGSLDGLAEHATLVDGAWPAARTSALGPIQVVVADAAARELGLRVGDELPLVGHTFGEPFTVPVRLVGTFTIDAISDPYWTGDEQLTRGIVTRGSDRVFGPFLTTPDDLLRIPGVDSFHAQWLAVPDFGGLTVEDAAPLRARLEALPSRLGGSVGEPPFVSTGLPRLLADAERSLLVSRTEVLLLMAQLAIIAGYAILLTAALLGEHRRIDSGLVRSRGASAGEVAWLALGEAIVIALSAVVLAPWLALGALSVLELAGPLAEAGLRIAPAVTLDAYAFAAGAGVVCVVLLTLPAALAARGFAAEQRELSRQETRTIGQRLGLDVALLAITGIGIWQLRLYGAPLTRALHGSLGLDPLLVTAPAVGLLTGGVLALRFLPLLARLAEVAISRGRDLVGSLGTRQLARRPLRYTRSALLVMLALSTGVFGLSYGATWSSSQQDQAAYQTGAAVRVTADRSPYGLPASTLPAAYAAIPGVGQLSAVERDASAIRLGVRSADLLALDAAVAPEVVLFRADESAAPLGELMARLRAGRPEPPLVTLPDAAAALRMLVSVDLPAVTRFRPDGTPEALDPAGFDLRVGVSAILRDARGLLYRVQAGPVAMVGREMALVVSLAPDPAPGHPADPATPGGGRLAGPVQLAGLGLDVALSGDAIATAGIVGLASVAAGSGSDGPWTELPLGSAGGWNAAMGQIGGILDPVPAAQTDGTSVHLTGDGEVGAIVDGARLNFTPAGLTAADGPVPVIANQAFLDRMAAAAGDAFTAIVAGHAQRLAIAGVVDSFPTTDPARPLLILDEPTLGLLRLEATGRTRNADEWWIATADGASDAVADALRDRPFDSASVASAAGRAASLRADPVALGIIGALLLGAVATGLFAIVGLTVGAAVSARQRRTEFALLRALGLSGRQLSAWLWLENGSLVVVSLLAGTGLGLFIGWLALPFVTVTQQATAPVPSVIVRVPWDQVLALDVGTALALGLAVALLGRVLRRFGVGSVLRMGED